MSSDEYQEMHSKLTFCKMIHFYHVDLNKHINYELYCLSVV